MAPRARVGWLLLLLGGAIPAQAVVGCDNYDSVTVTASSGTIAESPSSSAQFIFRRTLAGSTERLTILVSGTAANGQDYETIPTQVAFPLGQLTATITVVPRADALIEYSETVSVQIVGTGNPCILIGNPNLATISIVEGLQDPLATALDTPGLVWTTDALTSWNGQAVVTHDGIDAAESSLIADRQESWMETTVSGPGTVSFWWQVSSEVDFDWLRFHVDGVLQHQISGEIAWQQRVYNLPPGTHTLLWRYVKDPGAAGGQDRAWVDQVSFTPASGAPVIMSHPANRIAWDGARVTFNAVPLGSPPLAQQWYFNETNKIPGATNASLVLNKVSNQQAGVYRLVVTNSLGTVSTTARLNLITNGLVNRVLLFVDSPLASPFEMALNNLGLGYQRVFSELDLNSAVGTANRATTLVIVDSPQNLYSFSSFGGFINGGGRILIQANSFAGIPSLAALFGVTIDTRSSSPLPVSDWGTTPLFSRVGNPVNFAEVGFDEDAQRLHAMSGAYAVAGFVANEAPGEAAVVVGNGGRTIVNGFWLECASSPAESVQFAENEILFLTSPVSGTVPLVKRHPADRTVLVGRTVTLEVRAWGGLPLSFQWFKDGEALAGATGDSYVIANATMADTGRYRVAVSNTYGEAGSREATVTVVPDGPVGRIVVFADDLGASPYPAAVGNLRQTYEVALEAFSDEGAFNAALAGASVGDTLAVVDAPLSLHNFYPLEDFVRAGGRAILQYWNLRPGSTLAAAFEASVVAPYYSPQPVYDWGVSSLLFSAVGSPLSLVELYNSDGLTLQPMGGGEALAGFYWFPTINQAALIRGNNGRTLLSGFFPSEIYPATAATQFAQNELELFAMPGPPVIVIQPQDSVVALGGTASIMVRAGGTLPLSYQWRKEGTDLAGATASTFSISGVQSNHLGGYSAVISNPFGVVTSRVAQVDMGIVPIFVQHPLAQSVVVGGSVTFSAEIIGHPAPFGYEWLKSSTPLSSNALDKTVTFFTLKNVQLADGGLYQVIARNAARPAGVASSFAALTVLADADGDGMPDVWESQFGLEANSAADRDLDSDADGLSNWQEYTAGTDPTNALSCLKLDTIVAASTATVSFTAISNKTYTVQTTSNLVDTSWSKLADVVARETNRVESILDPTPAAPRYYRLVTPRQP